MAETEGKEQFKVVQELMHEMVAMWQRVKDLEATDRENRQEIDALRTSEARFRCVVEKLPLRFFFKDSGLNYVLCSDAYALDWEMKAVELSGKSDRDLFSLDVVDKLADVEYEVIRTGKMEVAEEDRLVAGREITVLAIRKPIIDHAGNTLGLLGVLWDITEDKQQKAIQQRRIYELEGALSERVGQVESLRNELETLSMEKRQKEEEFSRLRSDLEAEITTRKEEFRNTSAEFRQKEEEFIRLRTELETERTALKEEIRSAATESNEKEEVFNRLREELETDVRARREEIHRLRNELQKEMFERGQALEALRRSVAHSQELLDTVQKVAGA
jgi:hypothetical protein